jgi:quaternary ammonium compound-resistance protein SugE
MTLFWLGLASICQTAWIWSTTKLSGQTLRDAIKSGTLSEGLKTLFPLFVYLAAGICNVWLLTVVMRAWPASLTYGVWTGLVMVLAAIREWTVDKKPLKPKQILFLFLIFIGIAGLHFLNDVEN